MAGASRATWTERIEEWNASGLTAEQFAAEIGVREKTLKWWRAELRRNPQPRALVRRDADAASKPKRLSALSFVEMTGAVDGDRLEVVLPSSVRIRVRPGFDVATLARLLDVLEARR